MRTHYRVINNLFFSLLGLTFISLFQIDTAKADYVLAYKDYASCSNYKQKIRAIEGQYSSIATNKNCEFAGITPANCLDGTVQIRVHYHSCKRGRTIYTNFVDAPQTRTYGI